MLRLFIYQLPIFLTFQYLDSSLHIHVSKSANSPSKDPTPKNEISIGYLRSANSLFKGKRIRDATLSIIIHSFTFAP